MKTKRIWILWMTLLTIASVAGFTLSACDFEFGNNVAENLRGSITGNTYTIDTFDNNGDLTLKTHGSNISIGYNTYREKTYSDGSWGYVKSLSSVFDIKNVYSNCNVTNYSNIKSSN